VALEEAALAHGARIVSLAPGVIDTDMQSELRAADRDGFPEGARFADLKAQGQLDSPDAAAAKVLRLLARPDFGAEPIADVRDA
jgi:NAD(P)-dependent dehydrogenase (short-subunit alcohol dehydrogenase family)